MKSFRVEVFADQRPILMDRDTLEASSVRTALGRAFAQAKPRIRRRVKTVTVRVTNL